MSTAIVMLVTSMNCFCSASRGVAVNGNRPAELPHRSCCDADPVCNRPDHCPDQNKKHSGHNCPHCQGTLIGDNAPAIHRGAGLDYSAPVAILASGSLDALTHIQIHWRFAGDSPPPACMPPTLLGLNCALTL